MTKRESELPCDQHAGVGRALDQERLAPRCRCVRHVDFAPLREQRPKVLAHLRELPACADRVGGARARQIDPHFLDDAPRPRAHHQDAVGEEDRLVHVVGDEHDGFRRLREDVGDLALELLARDGVERPERLVEQQDAGVERERPREPDALLHAAGNLVRIVRGKAVELDELHEAFGARLAFRRRKFRDLQAEGDVLRHREPRKQVELLEHHGARRRRLLHALARHEHGALGRGLEAMQDAQQRGLAAPARADDGDELAGADFEANVAQHHQVVAPASAGRSCIRRLPATLSGFGSAAWRDRSHVDQSMWPSIDLRLDR